MSPSDLRSKYGAGAFDTGLKLQPKTFECRVAQRDALDQNFTQLWLDFVMKGLSSRPALDLRTRLLVLAGQYTMAKSYDALEDTIRAALAAKVPVREVLEIILQCVVYGGHVVVDPAIQVFYRVAEEKGLLAELRASQLPQDGNDRIRSREEESKTWHPDDVADPRFKHLIERYGWRSAGRGLTLRPRHHLNILSWLDKIDPELAGLWVTFCYGGMYSRGIVDEVRGLLGRGVPPTARPFGGLVYRQVMEMLHGVRDEAATRALIVQENRRYARRQLIWFRKEPNLIWFDGAGEREDVQMRVEAMIEARNVGEIARETPD